MYFMEIDVLPTIVFSPKIKAAELQLVKPQYIQLSVYISGNLDGSLTLLFKIGVYRITGVQLCCYFVDLWSYFKTFHIMSYLYIIMLILLLFANHTHLLHCETVSMSGQNGACKQRGQTVTIWLKCLVYALIRGLYLTLD